jgi:hypothetical protein
LKAALIDTDEQISDIDWQELPSNFNLSITAKGHYYLVEMLNKFFYLDLVLQDTPIFDKTLFEKLKTIFPRSNEDGTRNIIVRREAVKIFLEYLKFMEEKQSTQVKRLYSGLVNEIETHFQPGV